MEDKLNVLAPEVAKVEEIDKNNLTVVLEPFERGFGYTIGHSLRRIMLSYMPGAAVTEVKINGVSHEYGTIEGIKEDILARTVLQPHELHTSLNGIIIIIIHFIDYLFFNIHRHEIFKNIIVIFIIYIL